ncbi:MAG TPA: hypothetical protein VF262_01775 [Burkholderiales bacterium]|jgi:hypothetical protein
MAVVLKGKWIAWIAGAGALITFGPASVAMILFDTPVLPKVWSRTVDGAATVGTFVLAFAAVLWAYALWQGHVRRHSSVFLALGLTAYALFDPGAAVYARIHVANTAPSEAITHTLYYMAIQPFGTVLLLAPFLCLGWLSSSMAIARGFHAGLIEFAIGTAALGYMYAVGHLGSEASMLNHQWTAASLSVGLLPFESLIVLGPLALVTFGLRRGRSEEAR